MMGLPDLNGAISTGRQLLDKYGLTTLLVLVFVAFGIYDKYLWSAQMIDNQRQIVVVLAGVPSAVERNRLMAVQMDVLIEQTRAAAEAHRQQVEMQRQQTVIMERIIDRLDRIERSQVPAGGR